MGCSFARSQQSEISARVFRVYNVDDQGSELSPGRIEVGDTDLILHQKGKDPIKWPLRCLRRYGFDAELFSFESGRRCPTGPGIYAFKSRNAEALFNMVQECILRAGQDDSTRASHNLLTNVGRANSRPHSISDTRESYGSLMNGRHNSFSGSVGNSMLYVNGEVIQRNNHEYINTGVMPLTNGIDHTSAFIDFLHNPNLTTVQEPPVNYVVLDLPRSTENLCEAGRLASESNSGGGIPVCPEDAHLVDSDVFIDVEDLSCPEYMNVGMEGACGRDPSSLKRDHNYANLSMNNEVVTNNNDECTVNYIQLDLKNQSRANGTNLSPTSPTFTSLADSPFKKTESYATIDFKRMAALSNTRGTVDFSEGPNVRKTRHNSTIDEIM